MDYFKMILALRLVSMCVVLTPVLSESSCYGPQMKLTSDNARQTCTKIAASTNRIEYSCISLIKDFQRPMIKYCPVEVCRENGTWSKPSISCALSECYTEGRSMAYIGHRLCTASGRLCQRWDRQEPQKHRFKYNNMFPDYSISMADSYCRDPEGNKGRPWCFTTDPDKKWEFCNIPKCQSLKIEDGFCGVTKVPDESDNKKDETKAPKKEKITEPTDAPTKQPTTEQPRVCENVFEFEMKSGYRVKAVEYSLVKSRSTLECSTLCSQTEVCRMFVFAKDSLDCMLYEGSELQMVRSRGYKAGIKMCIHL